MGEHVCPHGVVECVCDKCKDINDCYAAWAREETTQRLDTQARQLQLCIDALSEIAYGGPSVGSLRFDETRGNEFAQEISRLRMLARTTFKELVGRQSGDDPNHKEF